MFDSPRWASRTPCTMWPAIALGFVTICASLAAENAFAQAQVSTADLIGTISFKQNDNFGFDVTANPIWTAGAQSSTDGSFDPNNQRAGRVFADFQLTQPMISAAAQALTLPGSTISFTFAVDSIGQGVTGLPYNDGLDLRYLGVSAIDRNAATLWNTPGMGPDQMEILPVTGPVGSHTVQLTNPSLLNDIAAASAGQYISFGMLNTAGVFPLRPVGNSTAETYGFQMNQSLSSYVLTINVVPEPASIALWSLLGMMLCVGARCVRRR